MFLYIFYLVSYLTSLNDLIIRLFGFGSPSLEMQILFFLIFADRIYFREYCGRLWFLPVKPGDNVPIVLQLIRIVWDAIDYFYIDVDCLRYYWERGDETFLFL